MSHDRSNGEARRPRAVGRSVGRHSTARGRATTGTIESMALDALEEEDEDVFVVKDARGRVLSLIHI